jgi:aspartyl-tRNA(Asn)/glutamyl-tRNA(Gln) amidotransferase subunit C
MITKKQVEQVAKLARLGIDEKEKDKFTEELSAILDFVEKLNEVKTDKTEPTSHVTGLKDINRDDRGEKRTGQETEKLLSLAPEIKDRQVKVKAIL